ncbi:ribonuclease H-like domain-containing protein [Tanacetum coccineum]
MNQFCEMKGILRQFSVARTPQQNGVTERRNRTLIEAARTMLADSKLPTTFRAEAVNTACYVQNRVLVVKPHNKTPYELFHGRTPTLSFMRPFGCPVTILNTIDHLGKFDGKADEGTQYNGFTDPKSSHDDGSKRSSDDGKKVDGDPRKDSECNDQENEDNVNSTNNVNAASTNKVNIIGGKTSIELPFDPNMPALEDYSIFDVSRDVKDVGVEADMNNLDTTIQVSPILTTRIYKQHPLDQVISDLQSATQTRRMSKKLKEHGMYVKSAFLNRKLKNSDIYVSTTRIEDLDLPYRVIQVKTASTPNGNLKALSKMKKVKNVDDHMYKVKDKFIDVSTSLRPDIIFAVCSISLNSDYVRRLDRNSYNSRLQVAEDKCFVFIINYLIMSSKTTAWNEFNSTMASAIICLATNQKLNFSKYIFESMIRNLDNLSGKFLMYPRNMRRVGKGFSGRVTPLFPTMMVQNQSELGKGSANPTDPYHTPTIIQSLTQPQKTQKPRKPKRKDTQCGPRVPRTWDTIAQTRFENVSKHSNDSLLARGNTLRSDEDRLKLDDMMALCTTLQNMVLDLEKTKTTQHNEIATQLELYCNNITITTEEITLAQALEALKTSKPKVKGIVFQEPEPVKPMKNKDQISFDEEVALKLQVEFDEEERHAREKDEKEKEANIALIEE